MSGTAEIENYLPLVEQIVVQVAVNFPRHVDRGELVRAGVLGLVEAGARVGAERGGAVRQVRRPADPGGDLGCRAGRRLGAAFGAGAFAYGRLDGAAPGVGAGADADDGRAGRGPGDECGGSGEPA